MNQKESYSLVRKKIKSGDVVFYSSHNGVGDRLIKWGTRSRFSHVGMAFSLAGRIFLIEASGKKGVRMVPMSKRLPDMIFHLSQIHPWNSEAEEVAMENMMEEYSFWEAFRAWLGLKEGKGKICTKYIEDIAIKMGYDRFPQEGQVPQTFYEVLLEDGVHYSVIDVEFSKFERKHIIKPKAN